MFTSFKIDLVIIIIAFIGILILANYKPEAEPSVPVPDEVMEEVDAAIDSPEKVSLVEAGDVLTFDTIVPDFGLTIQSDDPCSLDLEEVSCDDVAAVVKYRRVLNDIEIRELQEDIKQLEQEQLNDEYGIVEC